MPSLKWCLGSKPLIQGGFSMISIFALFKSLRLQKDAEESQKEWKQFESFDRNVIERKKTFLFNPRMPKNAFSSVFLHIHLKIKFQKGKDKTNFKMTFFPKNRVETEEYIFLEFLWQKIQGEEKVKMSNALFFLSRRNFRSEVSLD